MVEEFKKTMEVALDGKLGPAMKLLKEQDDRLKKLEGVTKMAGISNGHNLDFSNNQEKVEEVAKSEDAVWNQSLNSTGSFKRPAADQ